MPGSPRSLTCSVPTLATEPWTCQRAAALTGSWRPLAHGSWLHACVQVSDTTFADTLLDVLRSDPDHAAGRGKTLVFVADGAAAERAAAVLAGGGVRHVVYHKSRPMAEQAAALEELRGREGAVMVCTDAAARGLDVQGITHVVQVGVGRQSWVARWWACKRSASGLHLAESYATDVAVRVLVRHVVLRVARNALLSARGLRPLLSTLARPAGGLCLQRHRLHPPHRPHGARGQQRPRNLAVPCAQRPAG